MSTQDHATSTADQETHRRPTSPPVAADYRHQAGSSEREIGTGLLLGQGARGRGNGPVRAAAAQAVQRTLGNRAAGALLGHRGHGPLAVQRHVAPEDVGMSRIAQAIAEPGGEVTDPQNSTAPAEGAPQTAEPGGTQIPTAQRAPPAPSGAPAETATLPGGFEAARAKVLAFVASVPPAPAGPAPRQETPPPVQRRASGNVPIQRAVGIAKEKSQKAYVKAIKQGAVGNNIPRATLLTLLETEANAQLQKHRVSWTPFQVGALGGSTKGRFQPLSWQITLDDELVKPTNTQAEAYEASTTAYHEARHAEQWFSIVRHAQLQLDKKFRTKSNISSALAATVKGNIIDDVMQVTKGFDKKEKKDWAQSMYGHSIIASPMSQAIKQVNPLLAQIHLNLNNADAQLTLIVGQMGIYDTVRNDRTQLGQYPLATAGWDGTRAGLATAAWQACLNYYTTNMGAPTQPGDCMNAGYGNVDPTLKGLQNTYLQVYAAQVGQEGQAAVNARQLAFAAYQNQVDEADAFALQDSIRQKLNA